MKKKIKIISIAMASIIVLGTIFALIAVCSYCDKEVKIVPIGREITYAWFIGEE